MEYLFYCPWLMAGVGTGPETGSQGPRAEDTGTVHQRQIVLRVADPPRSLA